ncbi:MAG: LytR/AlgR family response regulator transcription factor [Gemmatimonadota bacterium]
MTRTVVIVDDDVLARERLRDLLAEVGDVEVIGEAGDGEEGLEIIEELRPDLVFLDIEMPEMSGLEVARRLSEGTALIFTTAYKEYAVQGFELAAVDYLLKPFNLERLKAALERLPPRSEEAEPASSARERMAASLTSEVGGDRVFLRHRDTIVPVTMEEIMWVEAEGDYVTVHTAERDYLVRLRLHELESRLGSSFLRIHRSYLVNLTFVDRFEQHDESRLKAVLKDGTRIIASRARSRELRRRSR